MATLLRKNFRNKLLSNIPTEEKLYYKDEIVSKYNIIPEELREFILSEFYIDKKFGDYTVIEHVNKGKHRNVFLCRCKCGFERYFSANEILNEKIGTREKPFSCKHTKEYLMEKYYNTDKVYNKIIDEYKRSCKKRGNERNWELTDEEAIKLFKGDCFYCGAPPSNSLKKSKKISISYNGIDRADNTKGYTLDNTVSCCKTCNIMKHTKNVEEFLEKVLQIYNHQNNKYGNNIN